MEKAIGDSHTATLLVLTDGQREFCLECSSAKATFVRLVHTSGTQKDLCEYLICLTCWYRLQKSVRELLMTFHRGALEEIEHDVRY